MRDSLTKSGFLAGLQCPKRLWLQIHKPQEAIPVERLAMHQGIEVGEMARRLHPGVLVTPRGDSQAALEATSRLLADDNIGVIHEAAFRHRGLLVRTEMLARDGDGWVLTEVKAATKVKPHHIPDVAVQAWVVRGCGLKLRAMCLMHVNADFVYRGDGRYCGLLVAEDVSREVRAWMPRVPDHVKTLTALVDGKEPRVMMGKQCLDPYECEFRDYCTPEEAPEFPVTVLPHLREPERSAWSIRYADVRDIPEGALRNEVQRRVWRSTRSGREDVNATAVAALRGLPWPRYYLDFETIGLAVPSWIGVRPYMPVPFQWSCHTHHADGRLEHAEFLDVSGDDPRRPCAESLLEHLKEDGIVLAYNAGFEKRVLRSLADHLPDLRERLLAVRARTVDLLPLVRRAYYHPLQKGSWSIKRVLEALAPELSYKGLKGIHHGDEAQLAWLQAVAAGAEEKTRLSGQLREYCKHDTLAMVKIVTTLTKQTR